MNSILLITEHFWPEDFIINDFATELVSKGIAVTVLTQQPSYPRGTIYPGYRNRIFSREEWRGVRILRLPAILGYKESLMRKILGYIWFALYGTLIQLFISLDFESVLIYQVGPLSTAIPAIIAGRVKRKKVSLWIQDLWPDSVYAYGFRKTRALSRCLEAYVRWVYGSVDSILISCHGFSRSVKFYSSKPLTYAPNWPLSPYTPGSGPLSSVPIFLFAGNLGKVQNLENVIQGFGKAFGKDTALARLRIVGDGSAFMPLQELARREDIPVEFVGRKSLIEMNEEYDQAEFLILSLADEPVLRLTIPSKYQMYLSVAKPILCAAAGETAEAVDGARVGIVSDPNDPNDIGRAFLALSQSSKEQRRWWTENAHTILHRDFDRDSIISTIQKTMDSEPENGI